MKHKIQNIFLFPVIIGMSKVYINTPERYAVLKELSFNKMFKWQWRLLDKILKM